MRDLNQHERGAAIIEIAMTIALLVFIAALALPRLGASVSSTFASVELADKEQEIGIPGGGDATSPGIPIP